MRTGLLSATLLAGCMLCAPARAQLAVQDQANLFQNLKAVAQQIQSYETQVQQLQNEIQTATTTYNMLQSFVQNPSLGVVTQLLGMVGLNSSMPVNPYAVQSLINGKGGIQNNLGSLSTLANSSFNTNSVYTCTNTSWACQQQQQTANGLAGQQAIAMNAVQTLAQHQPILQAIRDRLATATTPAERENAMAALQTENAWATEEGNRLTAAGILISSERESRSEQASEKLQKDLQGTISSIPGG